MTACTDCGRPAPRGVLCAECERRMAASVKDGLREDGVPVRAVTCETVRLHSEEEIARFLGWRNN